MIQQTLDSLALLVDDRSRSMLSENTACSLVDHVFTSCTYYFNIVLLIISSYLGRCTDDKHNERFAVLA